LLRDTGKHITCKEPLEGSDVLVVENKSTSPIDQYQPHSNLVCCCGQYMLAAYEHGEDINSGGGRRRSQPWKVAISIPLPG